MAEPDPRLTPRSPTANETLQNRAIRHAIDMRRLGNAEVARVVAYLNDDLHPRVRSLLLSRLAMIDLRNGKDFGPETTERLRTLNVELESLIQQGTDRIKDDQVNNRLPRIATVESTWQAGAMSSSIPAAAKRLGPAELVIGLPPPSIIRNIVDVVPMQGGTVREWWDDYSAAFSSAIDREVKGGILAGQNLEQIITASTGKRDSKGDPFAKSRADAEAVVRTSVNHVASQAREATYNANADIVKGVKILATLDSRTTPICQIEDGKVYPPKEGPRPPFHFNCRTTTVAVLKSLFELGITKREAAKLPEGVRESIGGPVPGGVTFPAWIKSQPARVQDAVLGPVRAKAFREGRLELRQFYDNKGEVIPLSELEKSLGIKFDRNRPPPPPKGGRRRRVDDGDDDLVSMGPVPL